MIKNMFDLPKVGLRGFYLVCNLRYVAFTLYRAACVIQSCLLVFISYYQFALGCLLLFQRVFMWVFCLFRDFSQKKRFQVVSGMFWVWLGWFASLYAVKKQVSGAPSRFTLFHFLCMLLKLFRLFNLFKSFLLCCSFFFGFWVVTGLDYLILGYPK